MRGALSSPAGELIFGFDLNNIDLEDLDSKRHLHPNLRVKQQNAQCAYSATLGLNLTTYSIAAWPSPLSKKLIGRRSIIYAALRD